VLEQQDYLLDHAKLPDGEKLSRIDLQQKIQAAVISGTGWEGIRRFTGSRLKRHGSAAS